MKLMVQSYNNGGSVYNAEAEETAILYYRLTHRFNEPAEAFITLDDPTGAIAQKYNVDANDVYIGAGKVTIEDPTATDIFYGRIMNATANTILHTVELYCLDWLSQLDEEQITYDMREKLGTTDLRQSAGRSDVNYSDFVYGQFRGVVGSLIYYAQADDGGAFTVESIEANELTEDDMTLLPAVPAVNDAYYFGFDSPRSGFSLYISQQGDWDGTITWEYYNGAAWTALADFLPIDAASRYFEVAGQVDYSWTVPGDWAQVAVNGVTNYWVRARVNVYAGITTQPLGRNAWEGYFFFDDGDYDDDGGMAFVDNAYDGMNLILTTEMAGKKEWTFHANRSTVSAGVTGGTSPEATWTDDGTVDSGLKNADWDLTYTVKTELGHNTPSDFYVNDSITAASLEFVYRVSGVGNHSHIEIYDNNAAGYEELHLLEVETLFHRDTLVINQDLLPYIVNSDGEVLINFNNDRAGGNCTLEVAYLAVHMTTETTGYSTVVVIDDTLNPNVLKVNTDLTAQATQVWETIQYCIAKPIWKHIKNDGASQLGTIITGGDDMETLTCNATIESTSGISTRQFVDRTRLDILRDLRQQDKAEFWLPLGSTMTVIWKSTWNDGAADETLSDTDVNVWRSIFDYASLTNKVTVEGARIGDTQLTSSYTDTTSTAKYNATRTKTTRDTGLVSEYDTLARATALATQNSNVQQMLTAFITGNVATSAHDKTMLLGDEIQVTSSDLGLTNEWYIVRRFDYDSKTHESLLSLHPRVSQTGLQKEEFTPADTTQTRKGQVDKYVPDPVTNEVA